MKIKNNETGEIVDEVEEWTKKCKWVKKLRDRSVWFDVSKGWRKVQEPRWVDVTKEVEITRSPSGRYILLHHQGYAVDLDPNYRFIKHTDMFNRTFIVVEQRKDSE